MYETLIRLLTDLAVEAGIDLSAVEAGTDERPFANVPDEAFGDDSPLIAALTAAGQDPEVPTADLLAIVDVVEALRAEDAIRETEAAEEQTRRAEAIARLQSDEDGDEDETDDDAGDAGDDEDETDTEDATADEALEPVLADGRRVPLARLNPRRVPASLTPTEPVASSPATMTMLVDAGDTERGARIESIEDLARAFSLAVNDRLPGKGERRSTEKRRLARIATPRDDARHLGGKDVEGDSRRIQAALVHQQRQLATMLGASNGDLRPALRALVASGGLCAPRTPYYQQAIAGDSDRVVADSMVRFTADRGGVTYNPPTSLTATAFTDGVSVWTAANDATPSNPTVKPCLTITCEDADTVDVAAVTQCLEIGNFRGRTFPEQVEAWLHWLDVQHAREAETALLAAIIAAAGAPMPAPRRLGIARDFFYYLELVGTNYRDQFRMGEVAPLQLWAPWRMKRAIIADLMQEMPGASDERFALASATVDEWIARKGIAATWFRDTQNTTALVAGQMEPWPSQFTWYLEHTGGFLFLDGGVLNLGIGGGEPVRDSGLVETNDLRLFSETFEAAAHVGLQVIAVRQDVCVTGASAGTVDPADLCAVS